MRNRGRVSPTPLIPVSRSSRPQTGSILSVYVQNRITEKLLIRVLMFRQDYRINKIFLSFRKKGKKHDPSSRGGVHSLRRKTVMQGNKHPFLISRPFFPLKLNYVFTASSGSREKNQINLARPVGPADRTGVQYKNYN